MCFRKVGGRRKEYKFEYEKKKIEVMKSFAYLGYKMKSNNKENNHIKKVKGKANG